MPDFLGELEGLACDGRAGIPAAPPQLRSRNDGKDLSQGAERPGLPRPGGCLMVNAVGRLIVAEVERSSSGEEERVGLIKSVELVESADLQGDRVCEPSALRGSRSAVGRVR